MVTSTHGAREGEGSAGIGEKNQRDCAWLTWVGSGRSEIYFPKAKNTVQPLLLASWCPKTLGKILIQSAPRCPAFRHRDGVSPRHATPSSP